MSDLKLLFHCRLFTPYPGNVTIELRPPSSVVSLGTTPLKVQVTKGTRRMDIPAADGPPVRLESFNCHLIKNVCRHHWSGDSPEER